MAIAKDIESYLLYVLLFVSGRKGNFLSRAFTYYYYFFKQEDKRLFKSICKLVEQMMAIETRGESSVGLSPLNLTKPDYGLGLDYTKSGLGSGLVSSTRCKMGWARA